LFRLSNWENPTVDIIPLFESVDDLQNAHEMMEKLYLILFMQNISPKQQTNHYAFSDGTETAII
jgi:phosphoenolpyruvate carboxylase